jgi:fructose-1,6-bisphosphatase
MIRRLIILLLIVGCGDSGTTYSPTCMQELEVVTCEELEELYTINQENYNNFSQKVAAAIEPWTNEERDYVLKERQNSYDCLSLACPQSSILE